VGDEAVPPACMHTWKSYFFLKKLEELKSKEITNTNIHIIKNRVHTALAY